MFSIFATAGAQEQEGWLLAGWQRSKYDEDAGPSLGVIVNIDRVVVVTGVSSGIGYGVAKSLMAHQCHIFGRRALSLLPLTAMRSLLQGCLTRSFCAQYSCSGMQRRAACNPC